MGKEEINEKILAIPARLIVSYTIPALIKGFDFFNKVSEFGPQSINELAMRLNVDERVLGAVISFLLKEGYFEEDGENRYKLSLASEQFLTKKAAYDLSGFALIFEENVPKKVGDSIIFSLRTGKPANWRENETWEEGLRSGALAKIFSEGVMSRGKFLADKLSAVLEDELSKIKSLVDIGGSLGDYCGKFTHDYSNLSCTVFDLPKVVENARQNIKSSGYERVTAIAGDMFKDEFPKNYDAHFYSSVLHDWSSGQNSILLKKSYDSLACGGIVIIHDLYLNNDKKSPSFAVDHSLMLATQSDGRCYSYKEIEEIIEKTGFKDVKIKKTVAGYGAIIVYKN